MRYERVKSLILKNKENLKSALYPTKDENKRRVVTYCPYYDETKYSNATVTMVQIIDSHHVLHARE